MSNHPEFESPNTENTGHDAWAQQQPHYDQARYDQAAHQQSPSGYPASSGLDRPSDSERSLAVLSHLAAIIAGVVSAAWLTFVGPLVLWFIYKDKHPFVRQAAAGAFNFNLSMWIMSTVGWILVFTVVLLPVGLILMLISAVGSILFSILGAISANKGQPYNYPMQLRLLH